jgi:putative ABC transport system ATP-binding protein
LAVIELQNIIKEYKLGKEKLRVLHGINLSVEQGEFIALMGPSGSGKSTLMNIIGCLDTPSKGKYVLQGQKVSDLKDDELAKVRNESIGFIFQNFNLMPKMTALENVELPLIYAGKNSKDRKEQASKVLSNVGLGDRMQHKPNELSGGQRQRVAVARSLVNNPSLLLADEPTGNLDTTTSTEIMNLFHELHDAGNTIIIVTHEEDIAQHAHRIVRLTDGQVSSDIINENPIRIATTKNKA